MDRDTIKEIAQFLINAEVNKQEFSRITGMYPNLSIETAYEIQEQLVQLKLDEG